MLQIFVAYAEALTFLGIAVAGKKGKQTTGRVTKDEQARAAASAAAEAASKISKEIAAEVRAQISFMPVAGGS